MLVAVMVVSITPRSSSAPSAISATTTPGRTVQLRSPAVVTVADARRADDVVRVGGSIFSDTRPAALIGAPNAISTAPTADLDDDNIASIRPHPDDRVIVLTSTFTYDVAWGEVADLLAPVGSIVMTPDGELLATFLDSGLRLLFD